MLNLDFAATFSIAELICFTVVGSKIKHPISACLRF